ncbi:VOC family protein [Kribbella sp. NPDC023855]|uniref:VOC family protein n=1 Tax=Kribbella sp. NPDC023855 TaxID=3154698 RepID=UPI003407F7B2
MFGKVKAYSGFSVDDIPTAETFYRDTLGLTVKAAHGMLTLELATGGSVLIYPKDDHVPAEFTVLNFPVDDIESTVRTMVAQGITFERYFDHHDSLGIARGDGPPIAWFKDPAGNILSVIEE